jgi:hypothetical protein
MLVWISRGGADDADAVIGEWGVHAGDFDFWHVATGAIACRDGAGGAGMVGDFLASLCDAICSVSDVLILVSDARCFV